MKLFAIAIAAACLAGCAQEPATAIAPTTVYTGPMSAEALAARRQHDAAAQAFLDLQSRMSTGSNPDPAYFEAIAAQRSSETRDRQAAIICRARGDMAGAQPAFGGFGVSGAINAGMQQGWAAANAVAACFNAYRQTGIMPAL